MIAVLYPLYKKFDAYNQSRKEKGWLGYLQNELHTLTIDLINLNS